MNVLRKNRGKAYVAIGMLIIPRFLNLLQNSLRLSKFSMGIYAILMLPRFRQRLSDLIESQKFRFNTGATLVSIFALYLDIKSPGSRISHHILSIFSLPFISNLFEFLRKSATEGLEEEDESEIDLPAISSLILGSLLGEVKASLMILIMLTGGEALEDYALNRAQKSVLKLFALTPKEVFLKNSISPVSLNSVSVGDVIVVKSKEVVPLDGVLEEVKEAKINEKNVTGEDKVVIKKQGDEIFSGGINFCQKQIFVEVSKPWKKSLLYLMTSKVQSFLESESKFQLRAKLYNSLFTDFTFFSAVVCFVLNWNESPKSQFLKVLTVLMSATTCPLQIGVPVCFLAGMAKLQTQLGCSVKSGSTIEKLSKVDAFVFDKTGTLTEDALRIDKINIYKDRLNLGVKGALRFLGSLEQSSTHPIAKSILDRCRERHIKVDSKVKALKSTSSGIEGSIELDGNFYKVYAGSEHGVKGRTYKTTYCNFFIEELSGNGSCTGSITFQERIRTDAANVIAAFRKEGEIFLLSGDQSGSLSQVAEKLGIDNVYKMFPHEKSEFITNLNKTRKALFVGDGINDSAAATAAFVSFSMKKESLLSEVSDIVVRSDKLEDVYLAYEESKNILSKSQNVVAYGMAASCLQVVLATFGFISAFQAASLQEAIDLGTIIFASSAIL
eukprot:snap_masked-scaffold_8-processed-gene-3.45-mRNA-1 protein AED:1.00 eAED:1.00 QI:0/-1/0/0/-1/1/1/0/668